MLCAGGFCYLAINITGGGWMMNHGPTCGSVFQEKRLKNISEIWGWTGRDLSADVDAGRIWKELYIQNHYSYPLQVGEIADYVGINRSYLYTLFKEQSGMSPKEYLTNFRITRAAQLLEITELSIESVAMSCGYQNTLGFSKIFKARMGVAPSVYKKRKSQQQKKEERWFQS